MKQNIRALIKSRKLFFITMLLFISIVVLSGKTFAYISPNEPHPFWLNVFFINYTFMGNGLFVMSLSFILISRFKRKQVGIAMLNSFLLSAIVIQAVKNMSNVFQPTIFIEQGQYLFFNNDSPVYTYSFISGHTVIAFALATVLILTMKKTAWQLPLLFAASLIGYSRIYLAQHFLSDILVSAMVGSVVGITAVYVTYYYKRPGYSYRKFFNINRRGSIKERNIQPV